MDAVRFYRWSLALPLAVPILAGLVSLLLVGYGSQDSVLFLVFGGVFVFSGLSLAPLVLIAYAVLALVLLRWMHGRSEAHIRRASRFAPLAMLPIQWAVITAFNLLDVLLADGMRPNWEGWWLPLAYMSAWILVVGYFYVALVNGALEVAKRFEWVAQSTQRLH